MATRLSQLLRQFLSTSRRVVASLWSAIASGSTEQDQWPEIHRRLQEAHRAEIEQIVEAHLERLGVLPATPKAPTVPPSPESGETP